jgi:hypothetical protein
MMADDCTHAVMGIFPISDAMQLRYSSFRAAYLMRLRLANVDYIRVLANEFIDQLPLRIPRTKLAK